MLHILWVILKIAGIIILSVILLLLVLLLCILLVPVRYRVSAKKEAEICADVRVSWLFHILYFRYIYENNTQSAIIRIFGIRIDKARELVNKIKSLFTRKNKNKKKKPENKGYVKNTKKQQVDVKSKDTDDCTGKQKDKEDKLPNQQEDIEDILKAEDKETEETQETQITEDTNNIESIPKRTVFYRLKIKLKRIINKLISIIDKIKKLPGNIIAFLKKLKLTFKGICDKIKNTREFINDEGNRAAFSLIIEQILVILRHIRPQKYKGYIRFGTGDPALTGQLLGIFGVFLPIYKDNIRIIPDFEELVFEGNIFLKGRITVIKLALVALKLYRDKNINRLIKQNGGNYVNR